jgi:hypothetical protein
LWRRIGLPKIPQALHSGVNAIEPRAERDELLRVPNRIFLGRQTLGGCDLWDKGGTRRGRSDYGGVRIGRDGDASCIANSRDTISS